MVTGTLRFVETTALGAAYLAGLATGFWKDEADIESSGGSSTSFEPLMDSVERKERTEGWKKAVKMLM